MLELLKSEDTRGRDGEGGQITILVVFGGLAFVLLVAFVFNTAKQTSRKIELQGAADAGAVASGVWMARGMNLTALNNNTMVEMLSIMITVRSILQTEQISFNILTYLLLVPYVDVVAEFEIGFVEFEMEFWQVVDNLLNRPGGLGWRVMTALDSLNGVLKEVFPGIALEQAVRYAQLNGADKFPYGWLIPGKGKGVGPLALAVYPLTHGPRTLLVTKAQECPLKRSGLLRNLAYVATVRGPITGLISALYLQKMFDRNMDSLMGRRVGSILRIGIGGIVDYIVDHFLHVPLPIGMVLDFADILVLNHPPIAQPLRWEANPRPMILTDKPEQPSTNNLKPNLVNIHDFLKYLVVALAETHPGSPIGGERYPNPDWFYRITYAQADVYNPTKWDMFTQDWRAKLVRARLLDVKCREMGQKLGVGELLCGQQGWGLVNTH